MNPNEPSFSGRPHDGEEHHGLFRALLEGSIDGVVLNAQQSHEILEVSDSFCVLTGFTRKELVGRTSLELGLGRAEAVRSDVVGNVAAGRDGIYARRLQRKDGDYRLVEFSQQLLGTEVVLTIVRDISERRELEERLRIQSAEVEAARDEALSASRLKSEFLAMVSHELRTPLNGVIGMTGLLIDSRLEPEQREHAEIVRHSAEALLTVINDILDFSKIEAGHLEIVATDFDVGATTEEVGELLAEAAQGKGLGLAILVDPGLPAPLRGDSGRLRQVLVNLVGNAVKFTDAGDVVVSVKVAELTDTTATVRFEVRDTGIGIAPEFHDRAFEHFSQAGDSMNRQTGGTGLGLAISQRLVALMDGEIGVESASAKGSTFWITVPFGCGVASASALPAGLAGLRVLVADDSAISRSILATYLTAWQMDTTVVSGAGEALAAAAAAPAPFDVVLADLDVPGVDGVGLAADLAAQGHAATPVVVMCPVDRREDARRRAGPNCAAFPLKPVRRSQLLDAIAAAVGRASSSAIPDGPDTQTSLAGSGYRILLADDSSVNQRLAALLLRRMGYRVDTVADGTEVLDALELVSYDAVVIDCEMPLLDGYSTAEEIRRREPVGTRMPIVAVSASVFESDVSRALESGMDAHVPKPIDRDLLRRTLAELLRDSPTEPLTSP